VFCWSVYILSKATFRTSCVCTMSPDYQNLKFSTPLPTDIMSILFLCCNNVCISIYHCFEWNRLPNLTPKMYIVSLLDWEYVKPKYLSSYKGFQCSCVLCGCSCDMLNNNGKVWFGSFVHPFSYICNIGHINYRLQFTTHLVIYKHLHNTI